jgi:mono/diheme cytochrome c family protein
MCVAIPSLLLSQIADTGAVAVARGRAIFVSTCRSCHTVSPPPQAAPPMSRIAQRYLAVSGSRKAAAAKIAEWLFGPSAEKSLLPPSDVARFGVMPHQPLADAGRFAVAAYVLTLADSTPHGRRRR